MCKKVIEIQGENDFLLLFGCKLDTKSKDLPFYHKEAFEFFNREENLFLSFPLL